MPEQIGLQAVLDDANWTKGVNNYINNVRQMDLKTAGLSKSLNAGFLSMGQSVLSFGAKAVQVIGVAAVGATAALAAGIVKLTMDAADLPGIEAAFDGIATASGKSAAEVLAALQSQSMGMIENRDLMEMYNKAAMLVSSTFANQLPGAMGYLSKVAAATGQDMGFMLDSLVTGVGRLSPMILDNLGIQVSLTEANQAYADSIGVAVGELTKEQQQAALMNQVLLKLEENTAAMPDVAENAATKIAALRTSFKNAATEIGKAFLPALEKIFDFLTPLVNKIVTFATNLNGPIDFLTKAFSNLFGGDFQGFIDNINRMILSLGVALGLSKEQTLHFASIWASAVEVFKIQVLPVFQTVWEWLSTNLPIAIAFVTEHWDEFKGALIAIGAVLAASGIVAAIAGIIAALNPVTLAIAAIVAAAAFLGAAWEGNWGGIRDTLTEVWTTTLQPALAELQIWLAENLPIAIEALKEFWVNTLKPALETVWEFIVTTLIPAFATIVAWLAENIPVAIAAASDFWNNTLKPALETIWEFITGTLVPAFEEIVTWLATNVPEAIATVSDFWENTLQPALQSVWDFITTYLIPIFEDVVTIVSETMRIAIEGLALVWEETLKPALDTIWGFLDENIMPVFEDLSDFLSGTATDALVTFKENGLDLLAEGLEVVKTWLEKVKSWVDKLATALAAFSWGEVGEGAMPKSPPKLAQGFEMITAQVMNFENALNNLRSVKINPIVQAIMKAQGRPLDDLLGAGSTLGGIGSTFARMFEKKTLDPMKGELKSLQDELAELEASRGQTTSGYEIDKMYGRRSELLTEIAQKQADIAREEERVLQIQKQQEQLGFLQEQMKLLAFIREQGLNPAEVLGDIKFGLDASIPDLIDATSAAMQAVIDAANTQLIGGEGNTSTPGTSEGLFPGFMGMLSGMLQPSGSMVQSTFDNRTFNMNNNVNMSGGMDFAMFRAMLLDILRTEFGAAM